MLEEDYYLTNFRSLVSFVGQTYDGLLTDDEKRWQSAILGASESAQRLYVRLISRKASIFRLGKLRYPEIRSIEAAALELTGIGLGTTDAPDDIDVLIKAHTKPELLKLLSLSSEQKLSRAALDELLISRNEAGDIELLQQNSDWFGLMGIAEFIVFKLCFFGNCYQDLSEFVLADLGVFNYERYRIDERSRVFQSREQIDDHLRYFECVATWEQTDQSDVQALLALNELLPANKQHDAHLTRRVNRMHNTIARQLERLDRPSDALRLYQQSDKPPSRERQVRVLLKLERAAEAKQLCDTILAEPYADEEIQFVETIQPKLYKLLNLPSPTKTRFRPVTTKLTLKAGNDRVEFIARDFYSQFGECFYVENSLINGVLGLFIWDIVFAPVEGVFYNPFQSAPADFYQPEFVHTRASMLEERFKELDDPLRFSARVWERFEHSRGISNPLVSWHYLSDELLSLALIRIPVDHWCVLFRRILADLRNHTSGLPDLILFPKDGAYEMLEIKGPGDVVQKNQRRWMAYFAEHRIPYRVVHIRWANQTTPA